MMYFAEETGLEPAHQFPDTGFQDQGDTNYALLFHFLFFDINKYNGKPTFFLKS